MQTLSHIKSLLAQRGLSPKKSLGQNFLIDHNLITKLIDASSVQPSDLVLEVGPGTGTLTEALLEKGCRVIACELDDDLSQLLIDRTPEIDPENRLTVIHSDCLANNRTLAEPLAQRLTQHDRFALVANLPYGTATPLILTLLMHYPACHTLAVTIQSEVVDRLCAKPSTKAFGLLSAITQSLARVEKIATLPKQCFWPQPDVTSAMVLLRRRPEPIAHDTQALYALCSRLFQARRKQIGSTLKGHTDWPDGVTPQMRAEQLTVEQLAALSQRVSTN